jgi:hypothetical protein
MINGHYWTGGIPFPNSPVWSSPIPANPKQLPNSAAIVAAQFPGAVNASGSNVHGQEAGQYDYGHPAYYATASDPVITWICNQYCNAPDNGGVPKSFHIPAKARPAGGSDAHMAIIQPDGTSIELWATYQQNGGAISRDWQNGDVVTAGNVSNAGNIYTGTGQFTVGPGADAMNSSILAGQITPAELIAGQINHAIFVTGLCAIGAQYPAPPGSATGQCGSGVGPPLGGREQYTVPCATTQASTVLQPWEKAILCALNIYGGYMGDDASGGIGFVGMGIGISENAEAGYQYGLITPSGIGDDLTPLVAAQGWSNTLIIPNTFTGLRIYSDHIDGNGQWIPPGVDFLHNTIWLQPCVTQQTC